MNDEARRTAFWNGVYEGRLLSDWIPDVISDIVRGFDPVKIVLFGSLARGDPDGESDIDLLVVLPEAPFTERRKLMTALYRAITAPVPVDVFVTDPDEIARRSHLTTTLLYPALREGIVVYERAA